jgi:capsular exopolysaccharide synthesis family protein
VKDPTEGADAAAPSTPRSGVFGVVRTDSASDLRRTLGPLWAKWPIIAATVLLAGSAGYLITARQPKTYQAQATLIVGQSLRAVNPTTDQLLASQRLSMTYASVATMRPQLQKVIEQLQLQEDSAVLASRVHADAAPDSTLLTITAQDNDPAVAASIANALADELIAVSPTVLGSGADLQKRVDDEVIAIHEQIDQIDAQVESLLALASRTPEQVTQLSTLEAQLVSLRSTYAGLLSFASSNGSNQLSIVEPADNPVTPVSPRPLLNGLLAAVLGLMGSAAFVFLPFLLDNSIKDPDDVRRELDLPTLGVINQPVATRRLPRRRIKRNLSGSPMAALLEPRSHIAEAYRTVRWNVEFASSDSPLRTLLVAGCSSAEGKTTTAANLAVVFAQSGRQVVLVDADLRRPSVHRMFGISNDFGLVDLIASDHVEGRGIVHETSQPGLRVVTSGGSASNPAEMLGSPRMRRIVEELQKKNDLVIFDSAPLNAATDAAVLSSFLDGTLLVVDASRTVAIDAREAHEALTKAAAHLLGAVLIRLPRRAYTEYNDPDSDRLFLEDGSNRAAPAAVKPASRSAP